MAFARFRFHGELNDFLPRTKKQIEIIHLFTDKASVKDTIESLGIPHPEVFCIEIKGKYVDFSYILQDGDIINVYPISAGAELVVNICLQPKLPTTIRFVVDIHLGKLVSSLRLLGFDTLYRNDYEDEELARISSTQERILLTRDRGLLMRSLVKYGYYVRQTNPQHQILEVMRRFNLYKLVSPFQRCLRCNGLLKPVPKESIVGELPGNIQSQTNDFHRCQDCKQVYWQGSHYKRLQEFIHQILHSKSDD